MINSLVPTLYVSGIEIVVRKFPCLSVITDFNIVLSRYNFKFFSEPNPFPTSLTSEPDLIFSGMNFFVP